MVLDSFGPPIVLATDGFSEAWAELSGTGPPFSNYSRASDPDTWLRSALQKLDQTYSSLGITDEDFAPRENEWQPIPLERENPQLRVVIETVDRTLEHVRGDNGYAANVPEERTYVLDNLAALAARLRSAASVSLPYLQKYGAEPLSILIRRFGSSALGIAATAAKEALKDWLKRKGINFLEWL